MLDEPVLTWRDHRLRDLLTLLAYAYRTVEHVRQLVEEVHEGLALLVNWQAGNVLDVWRDVFDKAAAMGVLLILIKKAAQDPTKAGFRPRIVAALARCQEPGPFGAPPALPPTIKREQPRESAGIRIVRMPGRHIRRLHEALMRHFPDPARLGELLRSLGHELGRTATAEGHLRADTLTIIRAAEAEGWLLPLIARANSLVADPVLMDLDTELHRLAPTVETTEPPAPVGGDHLVAVISYAGPTGETYARRLRDWFARTRTSVELRPDGGRPAAPSDGALTAQLSGADLLLIVATPGSLAAGSPARRELDRARSTGLEVIALLTAPDLRAALPPDVATVDDSPTGWAELARQLEFVASPLRLLWALAERREALRQEAARTTDAERARYAAALDDLDAQVRAQRRRLDDPSGSTERIAAGILARWERDGRAELPSARGALRCVNEPPALPPNEFRNRIRERQELEARLADPAHRLVVLKGSHGVGKTALVSDLYYRIKEGESDLRLDGFEYIPVHGVRPVDAQALAGALVSMVPEVETATRLVERLHRALPWPDRLDEVLDELGAHDVVLVIDNLEALLDDDGEVRDRDLRDLLYHLVDRRGHRVRLVLVTQRTPEALVRRFRDFAHPPLELPGGLELPHSYDFLRALDTDGRLRRVRVEEHEKAWLQQYTRGLPRAIELFFGILRDAPGRSFSSVLNLIRDAGPDVVEILFNWIFERLDPAAKRVLAALAACRRPVPPTTVNFVLQGLLSGFESAPVLAELHARRLIRRDGDAYYLPSPDAELVLSTVDLNDGDPANPYNRRELFRRAADYFARSRKLSERVRRVEDLRAEFTEIELRICAEQYDLALELIEHIDDRYLVPWKYSDALIPSLVALGEADLGHRDEVHRLFRLVRAHRQQDRPADVIGYGERALRLTARLGDFVNRARLFTQIGGAYFDRGELDRATRRYWAALRWAWFELSPPEMTLGLAGLTVCTAARGRFRRARWYAAGATALIRVKPSRDDPYLPSDLLLTAAWIERMKGRTDAARRSVTKARRIAEELDHQALVAQCLQAEAELLIDEGCPALAVGKARQASRRVGRTGNPSLHRDAREILALAHLCAGDLAAADKAVEVVGLRRESPFGWAMQGIIAARRGDRSAAEAAFDTGYELVRPLYAAGRLDVRLLDTYALLLGGLTLCGREECLTECLTAYRKVRRRTSSPGAVLESMRLLAQFGEDVDPELLARIRRAAAGD